MAIRVGAAKALGQSPAHRDAPNAAKAFGKSFGRAEFAARTHLVTAITGFQVASVHSMADVSAIFGGE
jgi:hypothetical protein